LRLHIQPDWRPLVGQFVEIRLHGETIYTGVVDAVMHDNSILWLLPAGDTRIIVLRNDGYSVWIRYKWE
jgi:hypothetical protein